MVNFVIIEGKKTCIVKSKTLSKKQFPISTENNGVMPFMQTLYDALLIKLASSDVRWLGQESNHLFSQDTEIRNTSAVI